MGINTVSFVVQFLFFGLGVYVYLFSRGLVKFGDEEVRARSEAFRQENAGWMRLMGLGLAAVMLANLIMQVAEASA